MLKKLVKGIEAVVDILKRKKKEKKKLRADQRQVNAIAIAKRKIKLPKCLTGKWLPLLYVNYCGREL